MEINDFANDVLNSANAGKFFDYQSKNTRDIIERVINSKIGSNKNIYNKIIPSLVTGTWQTLLESPALSEEIYPLKLSGISENPYLNKKNEKFILCLGNGNYCLLIFDPDLKTDEPIYFDASRNNSKTSIANGFNRWTSNLYKNNKKTGGVSFSNSFSGRNNIDNPINIFGENDFDLLHESIFIKNIEESDWPVIITKPPERFFTSLHPTDCHKIVLQPGAPFKSLAGVYTTNDEGLFGCTMSLHSFGNMTIESGKTQVAIDGRPGTVLTIHPVSDSCFIQIDADAANDPSMHEVNGPLSGTTPREFEKCSFINRQSKITETNVIGWSPDILYTDPYNQVKVITNPSTNPGDSGAALLDESGNVLGFSFYRTEINAVKEFSAWIWAASVYKAHNLKP